MDNSVRYVKLTLILEQDGVTRTLDVPRGTHFEFHEVWDEEDEMRWPTDDSPLLLRSPTLQSINFSIRPEKVEPQGRYYTVTHTPAPEPESPAKLRIVPNES
jgi:hypothetical protein